MLQVGPWPGIWSAQAVIEVLFGLTVGVSR